MIDHSFDWEEVRWPRTPWHETVIYEAHVKGFTKQMPGVREDLRGTYAGLAAEAAIAYLTDLGVTAVELLPIHHIADEQALAAKGLRNYWGYSSIGYLAPHAGYAATGSTGDQVREFKGMVKALHRAGIEVILDVVYNHTAEGNHLGPMLAFKGIDNLSYYRTVPGTPRFYKDYTGTGNSLNPAHPSVLRLIMDSLRYFVIECHVDGFRFDLASALAREFHEVDRLSAFFDIIHQDPVLSQVKLIAEPWDVGEAAIRSATSRSSGRSGTEIYRDTMRDFWRGEAVVGDFASRFTGSSDLYEHDGRKPFASINFITAHDGFTLRDLVTYSEKHNEANLEGNRDGESHNRSWNHGVEGETDDPGSSSCATGRCGTSSPRSCSRRGCRCCSPGTSSRGRRGQQQRLLPGQRALLARLGARRTAAAAARVLKAAARAPAASSRLPAGRLPDGRGAARLGLAGRLVVPHRRAQDDDRELAPRRHAHARRAPERRRDPDRDGAGRTGDRRHVPDPLQRRRRGGRLHPARGVVRTALGLRALDGRAGCRARRRRLPRPRRRPGRGPVAHDPPPHRLVAVADFRCTYRLQLGPHLDFAGARALVPYLRDLGVSHLYLSPSLQAREGSTHGYDVVDPTQISEPLGGEPDFRALCGAARDAGLGVVLDIVPNHMAATDENPFWRDPLWRARFFDLDWRTGSHRRFFDVGELAGVRMEDPEVWEITHAKVLELARDGLLDGLRIDHVDGLANPRRYLERLRESGIEHVWVEKILEPGEALRDWPVEGTTGYEFLNEVCTLFVDPAGEEPLTRLYEEIAGDARGFDEIARECKLREARGTLEEDAERLQALLPGLEADLPAALASLRVYRSYVQPFTGRVDAADRAAIEEAAMPAELRASCCSRRAVTTPSCSASSRRRRRCTRRASRTPPSTAGTGCSRSTRSAPIPRGSASRWRTSIALTSSVRPASRGYCWRR